jgi:hypothetical protein
MESAMTGPDLTQFLPQLGLAAYVVLLLERRMSAIEAAMTALTTRVDTHLSTLGPSPTAGSPPAPLSPGPTAPGR